MRQKKRLSSLVWMDMSTHPSFVYAYYIFGMVLNNDHHDNGFVVSLPTQKITELLMYAWAESEKHADCVYLAKSSSKKATLNDPIE